MLRKSKLFETKLLPVSSRNTAYQQYIDIGTGTYKTVHFALYPKDAKREKRKRQNHLGRRISPFGRAHTYRAESVFKHVQLREK